MLRYFPTNIMGMHVNAVVIFNMAAHAWIPFHMTSSQAIIPAVIRSCLDLLHQTIVPAVSSHLSDFKVELGGEKLIFDAPTLAVTLFLGNMSNDDDAALRADMEQFGTLERCFVMRNGEGVGKGYAIVEFSLPGAATKAKDAIEERFKKTFSEFQTKRLSISKIKAELRQKQAAEAAAWAAAAGQPAPAATEAEAADPAAAAVADAPAPAPAEGDAVAVAEDAPAPAADVAMGPTEAGQPESTTPAKQADEDAPLKLMRSDLMMSRRVMSLFSKTLYISNLPQVGSSTRQ